jgi:hypothetical protein
MYVWMACGGQQGAQLGGYCDLTAGWADDAAAVLALAHMKQPADEVHTL